MHLRPQTDAGFRYSAPPGTRLYAVGDIHGRRDLLDALLDRIAADAQTSAAARRVVVFLGDYVDRGPDSPGVLDRLSAGPPPGFTWIYLRGNHEDFLLRFLDDAAVGPLWLRNGGAETLAAYAGRPLPATARPAALQAGLRLALPRAHYEFLASLPTHHEEGDYFFAHAGARPGVALDQQSDEDLMWIRGDFLAANADFGKMVVHGHSIAGQPQIFPHRIGVDTGAYSTGRLTALVAEGRTVTFLST